MSVRRVIHWRYPGEYKTLCGRPIPKTPWTYDLPRCQRCEAKRRRRPGTWNVSYVVSGDNTITVLP